MVEDKFIIAAIHENRDCAQLTPEGLEGAQRKNPDLPISLMSLDSRLKVDSDSLKGLCYKRFTADLTLKGFQMPSTGARLQGREVTLVILPERKKCWPECQLFQEKQTCPLKQGVRYAAVESPGKVCLGEVLELTGSQKLS